MGNSLPVFTKNERGHWVTNAAFPSWIGFRTLSRAHLRGGSEAYKTGIAEVQFLPGEDAAGELTEADIQLADWVIQHEAEISASLLSSLLEKYPSIRKEGLEFLGEDMASLLPDVKSVNDFRKLIGFEGVFVPATQKDGLPYAGFCFDSSWDDEHDLGILMHGTRVVEIGGMDTAFLWWVPAQDAER
ncbi:MAG: hypothetical protein ABSF28_21820 [Terracidiphilus sp.]|jgi:hypothetical protein